MNLYNEIYEEDECEHEHVFHDGICIDCGWDLREAPDYE